jgi:hypothetical protein
MFVGHYGVSFAAKKCDQSLPLWLLFLAVQFLDVLWAPLILLGIEKVRIVPGITRSNPLDLYYMPYTHSLVAAVLWSVAVAGLFKALAPRARVSSAAILGAVVFSHWVLDLIVHRPDLPLYDNSAKVGLGLWNRPVLAFLLEGALLFGGIVLCIRTGAVRPALVTVFGLVMLGIQAYLFFGPPPVSARAAAATALVVYVVFAAVIYAIGRAPDARVQARDEVVCRGQ